MKSRILLCLSILTLLFTVGCERSNQDADIPKKIGQYEQFKIGDIISVKDYKISITKATAAEVLKPRTGYKWVIINTKAEAANNNHSRLPVFTLEDEEGNVYLPFNDLDDEKDHYDIVFEVPEELTDFKVVLEPSVPPLSPESEWKGVIPIKFKEKE